MDKIDKALSKLSVEERRTAKKLLLQLKSGDFRTLEVKKLRGRKDIYRVRKGNLRIIYQLGKDKTIFVLAIERRSKGTYKNL
ncbi:MAG: type II toxin-antitoxin system RelE/ParE family toxin [bacterium]|nr:type II toxin-antitoxin system RelE/ParE family toxin [bacterium]